MFEKKIHVEKDSGALEAYGKDIFDAAATEAEGTITKHFNIQMEKLEMFSSHDVPKGLISTVKNLVLKNVKPLSICLCNSIPKGRIVDHVFCDEKKKLNFVFTVFPWETNESVKKLSEASTEKPYGYINRLTGIFNSWPSLKLKYLFHMIICFDPRTTIFAMHCCIADYGGNPSAKTKFKLLPIDLLNDEEKEQTDL